MKHTSLIKISFIAFSLFTLASCESGNNKGKSYSAPNLSEPERIQSASAQTSNQDSTSSPANGFISSMIASYTGDTARKFVKTAEMKFRVKNVYLATYTIEDIIKKSGGFVSSTALNSDQDNITVTPISEDSSLETIHYTVRNTMVLRIPCYKLDTTLRTIAKLIDYLDYRTIKADDVEFDILFNQYTILRALGHETRLTKDINTQGKKLKETADAEDVLARQQEEADNAKIENLKINDKIKFSTINLEIYQRETLKRGVVANEQNIHAYEPGFWSKVGAALKSGWEILQSILIFLANIWFLYLFAFAGYIVYRLLRKKQVK